MAFGSCRGVSIAGLGIGAGGDGLMRVLLIACFTLLWPGMPTASDAPLEIRPGNTLKFSIKSERQPFLRWEDSWRVDFDIPFFRDGDSWVTITPVPFDYAEGVANLVIYQEVDGSKKELERRTFQVVDVSRGTETILFSPEKAPLLTDPVVGDESAEIRGALFGRRIETARRWAGLFTVPVSGAVISAFGTDRNKVGQGQRSYHWGVDFRGATGDAIVAPADGEIILVRDYRVHGKTVVICHGWGVGSLYIHLDRIDVAEGDLVVRGQTIGLVGMTGLATAPHLHWGVYVQGRPVDPEQWLRESF